MPLHASRLLTCAATATLMFGGVAIAAADSGPEPYKAADPVYAHAMKQEPLVTKSAPDQISLGTTDDISGPSAGPEPYSAPTPQYTPMKSEPTLKSK